MNTLGELAPARMTSTNIEAALKFSSQRSRQSRCMAVSLSVHSLVLLVITFVVMVHPEFLRREALASDVKAGEVSLEEDFEQYELSEPLLDATELWTQSPIITEPQPDDPQAEEIKAADLVFTSTGHLLSLPDAEFLPFGGWGNFNINLYRQRTASWSVELGERRPDNILGCSAYNPACGRRLAFLAGGGTRRTEKSVQGGLIWLARHQNPDGSWSFDKHSCKDWACTCDGTGKLEQNAAATAFALLPYLAVGCTHETEGPFKLTVDRGLNWLVRNQKPDGDLSAGESEFASAHAVATMALCDAFWWTRDKRLVQQAQLAINFIQKSQDEETGGWYGSEKKGCDTFAFGWYLMALKSGQRAGLSINPKTLRGAQSWLAGVSQGYKGGLFPNRPDDAVSPTMTAVGLLSLQSLGAREIDPRIIEGKNYVLTLMPDAKARNCYYWYYATQAMHNLPGPEWERWNRQMRRVLIETQTKEGCATGSWAPNHPRPDPYGRNGGRVMVTALSTLTLETYYRYPLRYSNGPALWYADTGP